ncbi:MAG TPA: class A beta-lactamase-related serine hydrolase [Pseudomonadales bacterium]|nr:class A beta-lactamase-related serine hydrolase [Pseudomonadales bacterium]
MVDQKFMANEPQEVGIDPAKLEALLTRVRKEVDEGLLTSVQVAIARHGKLAAFETYGDAPDDALYCIFSATKGITSAAAWLLIQEGKLDVSKKVIDLIPEFGENGKSEITIEQLFTHTAGFPHAPFRPTLWLDKEARVQRFSDWKLNWAPGSRFEYHPTSSMWIIAEIIERLSGQTYASFIRQRISEPLGLEDLWVGTPEEHHHRVAEVKHVGEAMTAADYAALGVPEPPVTEVTEDVLTSFNNSDIRQVPVPGGGGIMSAAEIALFYQALINGGQSLEGEQIWQPGTIESATRVLTGNLKDLMTGTPVNRALGVSVSGDEKRNLRGFGHTNSPMAFGHGGAGGQLAWGDPISGVSIGYCTNGHDRHAIRQGRRGISISNKAAVTAI